jgi:hypothetical protein
VGAPRDGATERGGEKSLGAGTRKREPAFDSQSEEEAQGQSQETQEATTSAGLQAEYRYSLG